MERKVSLSELSSRLSELNHLSSDLSNEFVAQFFEVLEEALLRENMVKIKGFGTFRIVQVAERESVDVNTGDRILIQGHSKLSFTPDAEMRDKVNKPFAAFEPIVLNEGTDEEEMAYIPQESIEIDEEESEQQFEVAQDLAQEENMELSPALVETEINTEEESIKEDDESNIPKENLSSSNQPVVPEPLQENPKTPELLIPKNTEMNENVDSKFQWKYLLYVLLTIFLMGVSYYAGYYRLLCPCQISQPNVVMEETEVSTNEEPLPQDTTAQETAKEEPLVEVQYPQVPGGAYLIVGVQGVHEMAIGDNLYKIARKEYGDNDFARYIIVLNQFKNPDKIPLGYHVKLPKLRPNK